MDKLEDVYTTRQLTRYDCECITLGDYSFAVSGEAVIYLKNGKIHRDGDQPAIVSGFMSVYAKDGLYYRESDQPAYEDTYGLKKWYVNGLLHRDNDSPAIESRKLKCWMKNGQYNRSTRDESGLLLPAIIDHERMVYLLDGKSVDRDGWPIFSMGNRLTANNVRLTLCE